MVKYRWRMNSTNQKPKEQCNERWLGGNTNKQTKNIKPLKPELFTHKHILYNKMIICKLTITAEQLGMNSHYNVH